jgi:hypothetical protein
MFDMFAMKISHQRPNHHASWFLIVQREGKQYAQETSEIFYNRLRA